MKLFLNCCHVTADDYSRICKKIIIHFNGFKTDGCSKCNWFCSICTSKVPSRWESGPKRRKRKNDQKIGLHFKFGVSIQNFKRWLYWTASSIQIQKQIYSLYIGTKKIKTQRANLALNENWVQITVKLPSPLGVRCASLATFLVHVALLSRLWWPSPWAATLGNARKSAWTWRLQSLGTWRTLWLSEQLQYLLGCPSLLHFGDWRAASRKRVCMDAP